MKHEAFYLWLLVQKSTTHSHTPNDKFKIKTNLKAQKKTSLPPKQKPTSNLRNFQTCNHGSITNYLKLACLSQEEHYQRFLTCIQGNFKHMITYAQKAF